jgi:arylsulfatase A-like enzyme
VHAERVHEPDESNGYEAAGGAAVYREDWKLVRSVSPYGDRKWPLYNLRDDPNEARDMSSAEPELARAMLADFAAYAARNGVIEVPADYDVIGQARANAAATK